MAREHQAHPTHRNSSQTSPAYRYIKKSLLRLSFYVLIACAAYYSIKYLLNPRDNFIVIINNRDENLSGPLSIRLHHNDKTFWTVPYPTGVGGRRARAYLIPHAIFDGNLTLESSDSNYSCEINPKGRYQNTIFIAVTDHGCACSININKISE